MRGREFSRANSRGRSHSRANSRGKSHSRAREEMMTEDEYTKWSKKLVEEDGVSWEKEGCWFKIDEVIYRKLPMEKRLDEARYCAGCDGFAHHVMKDCPRLFTRCQNCGKQPWDCADWNKQTCNDGVCLNCNAKGHSSLLCPDTCQTCKQVRSDGSAMTHPYGTCRIAQQCPTWEKMRQQTRKLRKSLESERYATLKSIQSLQSQLSKTMPREQLGATLFPLVSDFIDKAHKWYAEPTKFVPCLIIKGNSDSQNSHPVGHLLMGDGPIVNLDLLEAVTGFRIQKVEAATRPSV